MIRSRYKSSLLVNIIFILVAFFVISFSISKIYAAGITITTNNESLSGDSSYKKVTNTGKFSIRAVSSNEKFKAYKVLDVYYNQSLDAIRYQFTTDFQAFLTSNNTYKNLTIDEYMKLDKGDATQELPNPNDTFFDTSNTVVSGGHLTSNDYAKLMSAYATYVLRNNVTGTSFGNSLSSSVGRFEISTLSIGSYMVLPATSDNVYGVMVDSIQLQNAATGWYIKNAQIEGKTVENNINLSYSYGSSSGSNISVALDSDIDITITMKLPTYPADATNSGNTIIEIPIRKTTPVNMTLTTTTGTFNNNIQENIVDSAGVMIGTATVDAQGGHLFPTGTITLDTSKLVGGSTITFNYTTSLLSTDTNLVLGNRGNDDRATITYPDPYSTNNHSISATGNLKTYGIQIKGTPGAKFDVKLDNTKISSILIGNDGLGEVKGVAYGDYTITQTIAPPGYLKLTESKTLRVGSGEEVPNKVGYYGITMLNTIPALLPFTGGVGTIIFTVSGVLITILAIVLVIVYKRRKKDVKMVG